MPPVVISLFGPLTLTVNNSAVTNFRSYKVRALLAYLLLAQPPAQARGTICDLLWADYTEPSAQTNLRQALTNLRDCLAPFDLLQSTRTHLSLPRDPATLGCDVHQFEALLDACQQHEHRTLADCAICRPRLQAAVALAQAPLLEHFPATDSKPFNAWLQSQRERLAARLATAQAALAADATVHGNLPSPLTSLVGRDHELAALVEKLQDDVYRCVSLIGPGGIGKTRLAVAVGARLQEAFPDGVWLVELGGLAPTTPAEPPAQLHDRLATAIGQALRLAFAGATPPTVQVANHLAAKTALLILDSFEHLAAGVAWLPILLTAAPRLHLLITSRQRPPLQSQFVFPLAGLGVPPDAVVNEEAASHLLAQYTGVQLFVARATSAGTPLPQDRATLAAVAQLCRFVEGSPWAIELAVAMLDQQTPAAVLAAIQRNYRSLATPWLDVPLRQRSAEAVFLTTWALLTPTESQTLARCAIFRDGFTLDAAQRVADAPPAILDALVQKSLLRTSDGERYAMHDLVRQFAEEQLARNADAAHQRRLAHATYFTALLATWQPAEAIEQQFRARVTQDWANVQAAWAWAVAHDQVALLQAAVVGLAEYYEMMGLFQEAVQTLGAAAAQVRAGLAPDLGGALATATNVTARQRLLAHLLWRQSHLLIGALGQLTVAAELVAEVVAWGEQAGDQTLTAWAYYEASLIALFQGEYERQHDLLQQAIPLAQAQDNGYQQASCLQMLGVNLKLRNQFAAAQRAFEAALTLAERVGASRLALLIDANLASCHWDAGHLLQALTAGQKILGRAQQMAQPDQAAFATLLLGALNHTLGDYANGRRYLEASYQAHIEIGNDIQATHTLIALAELCLESGERALAATYCQQALAAPAAQTYILQSNLLQIQGNLHGYAGDWSAARTAYERAYALNAPQNLPVQLLPLQAYLAAVDLAQGKVAAALVAIEPLLAHFADTPFMPAQRPQELLLIAYKILRVNSDPRAPAVLQQAWATVQAQAATIDDPRLRETFLTNVPVNRALGRLVAAE